MKLSKRELAMAQFLTWVQGKHPSLYNQAIVSAAKNAANQRAQSGLGAEPEAPKSWLSGALDNLAKIGTAYLGISSQSKIIKMNIDRAKAGLPPIDIAAAGAAPVVSTQVSLSPEMLASMQASMKPALSIGAIALVAGVALFFFLKK